MAHINPIVARAPLAQSSSQVFTCGIDIGTKNLCISFLPVERTGIVISYKGSLEAVARYETGVDPTQLITLTGKEGSHEAYVLILERIPEFRQTISTVIEIQLSFNKSNMSRLDGVTYGFLRGMYPQMGVHLHGSGIRQKFINEALEGHDITKVVIPRGYPETKHLSFLYVGCLFPSHYDYAHSHPELAHKMDDVCDSIVYASIALADQAPKVKRGSKARRS